jgi:hypothetical protein
MNIHLGVERENANGHGEGRDEEKNPVDTIRKLQTDVQRHRDDNVRIMKAKEKQEDFKMKLIKHTNKIENKLDNGSGSNKSGRHRSPDEKRSLIWNIGRRETSHLFNVRVFKDILCIEIFLTEVTKLEMSTMYTKMKQWRTWA